MTEETLPEADDIVELLQMVKVSDTQYGSLWVYDAAHTGAAEIERLRAELEQKEEELDYMHINYGNVE